MSEAKFTKGPWVWVDGNNDQRWDGVDLEICHPSLRTSNRFDTGFGGTLPVFVIDLAEGMECMDEESRANTHLIAAAPELYEELQADINELIGLLDLYSLGSELHAEICSKLDRKEKLLAKARGE